MSTTKKIQSALISVFDKNGLEPIVKELHKHNVIIYSTGGTETFIKELNIPVVPVEDVTSYPSILGGRVKTLHPKIFGGILNRQDHDGDVAQMKEFEIPQIDLVIVDLYPFENTVASGAPEADIIEKIDIGGISLIRAAAKHFEDEITNKLKLFRGLKPSDEKNFFVNVFGGMLDMIEKIIGQMNVVGWIISGFSLLVGGFGIANIMFVSVKERTHLIGIQKAIGAKRRFILFQFLFEAVILSLIGGVVGIIMVWGIAVLVSSLVDFKFVLSLSNICIGLTLSAFIGVLSGYLPARSAARLDPVEAIRMGG